MKENENYANAPGEAPAAPAEKKRVNVPNLLLGLLVIGLALFGAWQLVQMGVNYAKRVNEEKRIIESRSLYEFLIPAAAIDIAPFEDISVAQMEELVEMSVWAVLNSGLDATQYQYEGDVLLLPEAQVQAAFIHFFGTQRTVEHCTVSGYGYEFTYDPTAHAYKIPLTTITPIYTPLITETETKGDSTVLTVGFLNSGLYDRNPLTGELTAPEPDKYVKVTMRTAATGNYISAVRSLGIPETAVTAPAGAEPEEEPEETAPADTSAPEGDSTTAPAGETEASETVSVGESESAAA